MSMKIKIQELTNQNKKREDIQHTLISPTQFQNKTKVKIKQ